MRDLLLDALAVFRMTRLLTTDALLDEPRDAVLRWAEQGCTCDNTGGEHWGDCPAGRQWWRPKIGTLASCPWCMSAHVGLLVVAFRRFAPRLWTPLAKALAYSALTGLISQREE
jgi:hypothetical protein